MKARFDRVLALAGSHGLAVVLLLLLSVLTLLGTLEQVDHGLHAVTEMYFASLFVVHDFFGVVPIPLPGIYLLLMVLFVNLLCGGIIRARRGWRHWGLLVAHFGILLLLAGSFVGFEYSLRGYMTLFEGKSASEFVSYGAWEVAVADVSDGLPYTEHLIPMADMAPGVGAVTFESEGLPFDLTLEGYLQNTRAVPADAAGGGDVIDGFRLAALDGEREVERNVPGAYVAVREKGTGSVHRGILWGMSRFPWVVTVGDRHWSVDLRRVTWSLPFSLRLDEFTRDLHPGTGIARSFISDVTIIEGTLRRRARISMNEPLRHGGYVLYQASWGPADAGPSDRLYSSLAVVRNPADQFPLYACSLICLGLLVHFSLRLAGYLREQGERRA